jgi:predicted naringenin-chalcone synthase
LLNGPYGSDEPYSSSGLSVLAGPLASMPKHAPVHKHARRAGRQLPRTSPRIAALATADGDGVYTQADVLARLGLAGDEFAERIFARCGVERRHLNLEPEFIARPLQDRTQQVESELLERAIAAVDALGIDTREIGTVISSSLYSLGVPSLAHRLIEHYGMDPSTDKYHVTSVGCASGVPLMRLAAQTLQASISDDDANLDGAGPCKHTLVVAAESMSGILTPASPHDPKAKTVGSSIFGDGCAAALIARGDTRCAGPAILASQVHQLGASLGAVSLHIAGEDSYLHLARELPDLAGAGLPGVLAGFLERHELTHADIDHWIVHPGGRRIIENVQDALALSRADVATSWAALADHGNIGTPSIFYVLKETIARHRPEPGERGMLVTIGPGVTAGLMLLGW